MAALHQRRVKGRRGQGGDGRRLQGCEPTGESSRSCHPLKGGKYPVWSAILFNMKLRIQILKCVHTLYRRINISVHLKRLCLYYQIFSKGYHLSETPAALAIRNVL